MSPRINPLGARGCEFGNLVHAVTRVQSSGRSVGAVRFQAASARLPGSYPGRLRPAPRDRSPVASYGRRRGNAEGRVSGFHLRVPRCRASAHGIRNRVAGNYGASEVGGVALGLDGPGDEQQWERHKMPGGGHGLPPAIPGHKSVGGDSCARPPCGADPGATSAATAGAVAPSAVPGAWTGLSSAM